MKNTLISTMLLLALVSGHAQEYMLESPDAQLIARINIDQNAGFTLVKGGNSILRVEDIELVFNQDRPSVLKVKKTSRRSVDEQVFPLIREKSAGYDNRYKELTITFKSDQSLVFRMFNEGLAYRFVSSARDSLTILRENLSIQFQKDDSIRYQLSPTFNSSYETPYEHDRLGETEQNGLICLPALIEKQNGPFVMITESDLYDYPGLWLVKSDSAGLRGVNPPFPRKFKSTGNVYSIGQITETENYIARVAGQRTYPWRLFAVADHEADLIDNNMVYLLATPTVLEDVSWIKPGVVMFDWWAKKYIYGVDFKSGINTETAKYFIDFCAAYGFRYFLFDDGWCPKDDLLAVNPDLDMEKVSSYAAEKGVDIMLWVIWHALERQWDEAFDQFEMWGIKGIKMDFMNRDDQKMVKFYEDVSRKAAEKEMVVNFHGAYKPAGLRRKYPNVLTREALIEFEYNGWSEYVNPEHHNLLPYIRMFTGPMDYIPATTRNSTKSSFRKMGDYPMGQGTRAHAMALFVILSSPMTMLPDSPSDYYREQECTDFIAKIPVEWDESRLLEGQIGDYTILGRRNGETWYVGAITDWTERSFSLNTDFLKPGSYRVEIIKDGINADTRAEDYSKQILDISAGELLEINLVSGGGWVARFEAIPL